MPPDGLEREPTGVEHDALADERERLAARARRRVRDLEEARCLRPSPGRRRARHRASAACSCVTSSTCTVTPRAAQQLARVRRDHVGRRLLLRGLVHQVACPRAPRRRSPRRARPRPAPRAPPAASTVTFVELRRLARRPCTRGTGSRRARSPRPPPARRRRPRARCRAVASVVATDATLPDAARDRGCRRGAGRRAVSSSGSPTPTSTAAFAFSCHRVGTASVSPGLPSNPASSRNAASPPSSAASTASAPGPSSPPLPDRDGEQVGGDPIGGGGRDGEREGHGASGGRGGRGVAQVARVGARVVGTVGADGTERPFLPPGERVHEVGETVQVRHHVAVGRASPPRAAATAWRSARRTTVRARSSAAATRFSPGSTNSFGGS